MQSSLIVGLVDGNGNLISSQPYNEFQYGRRSTDILIPVRGGGLIQILQDDIGNISYQNNRLVLKQIFVSNVNITAMTLLGKIAEAVLVRRCQEDEHLNRQLFQLSRRKNAWGVTARRFKAIGTGLKTTQRIFPKRYNPSDTQRDIIWVDDEGIPALMSGSSAMAGIEAGLQVKVSLYGIGYMVNDLTSNRYEVPMVYFPINNDFEQVIDRLVKDQRAYVLDTETGDYRGIRVGEDLVDIRAYDYDAFEEVKDYYPIVYGLINGDIDLVDLVDIAKGNGTLENTVLLTALSASNVETIVLE
ncbi:3-deoxy-7-phosphoheptulonate synthase [Acidilutibacter cellobiosedens]|jgi:hypothetical protein|uniref:3-deoxy-7-phosphoheptulonate synthase n=1 Tax=Acidilutibacter cellobiosedens TaxID=2507161 RepID=A0A410QGR8_9FIRM|nr:MULTISPECIES: 3-deoxy-7-phosphoheptulonate synthase [Bacillota]QAT63034.1 3-deoxy-7-phosphoheptulonate synthase [Acidilutibacter cellobiosedens]